MAEADAEDEIVPTVPRPPAEPEPVESSLYVSGGKTYRSRTSALVNASWSLDDIQEYARQIGPDGTADTFDPALEVPYESISDFVCTLRNCATAANSVFLWPSPSINFMKALTVAIHHLPPGCMVTITNARPLPSSLLAPRQEWQTTGGSQQAEASGGGTLRTGVLEYYHGTYVSALPHIMENGFKPTLGAGADNLQYHFGCSVPGVYVAKSWRVASTYPMMETTKVLPSCKHSVNGGTLVAFDGTPPLRCVIRCLANPQNQLWHRSTNQCLFRPQDLHITHICIYAVSSSMVHTKQADFDVTTVDLLDDNSLIAGHTFEPVCLNVTAATIASTLRQQEEYPVQARVVTKRREANNHAFEDETYQRKGLLQE